MRLARSGFTLLELVVALTIGGLAVTAGYEVFATLTGQQARIDRSYAELRQVASVRRTIASWLAGAHLLFEAGEPQFRGLDGAYQGMPDDELTLLTTADTPLGRGETVIRLYVDRDERSPERGLVAAFAEWHGTRLARLELAPEVQGFDLEYVSSVLGERPSLPSWISSTVLPAAVLVHFLPAPGDTLPPLLAFPILVSLGGQQ
jgi:prepilin-type N-terminal cleavage/methylation domain-containing protein